MTSADWPITSQNPDKVLWREIHQSLYDDPRQGTYVLPGTIVDVDWQAQVTERFRVQQICKDSYTPPTVSVRATLTRRVR